MFTIINNTDRNIDLSWYLYPIIRRDYKSINLFPHESIILDDKWFILSTIQQYIALGYISVLNPPPSEGGAWWGSITGTLNAQADLKVSLDDKAEIVHEHVASDIISPSPSGKFLKDDGTWADAGSAGSVPVELAFNASLSPDCDDGLFRKCTLSDDVTLNAPSNATEGMKWECWFNSLKTASGDIDFTLENSILIPTDSGFVSPKILTYNYSYILMLKYNGNSWMLVSLVGGFEMPA